VKVLVVEDDEAIAEALVSLLEEAGHHASHARDGRRALEKLRTGERTNLILLDMTMPVMSGWRFREEQMRDAALAGIPVVVCTADVLAAEKAREIGAAGWLRKPLDPERLLEVIGRFCGSGRAPS